MNITRRASILGISALGMALPAASGMAQWAAGAAPGTIVTAPLGTWVGIGINPPTNPLSVAGNANIGGNGSITGTLNASTVNVTTNMNAGNDLNCSNNGAVGHDASVSHDMFVSHAMSVNQTITAGADISTSMNLRGTTTSSGVYWGSNYAHLNSDNGGSMELGGDNTHPGITTGLGTAYIDFHLLAHTDDWNVRLLNSHDGVLGLAMDKLIVRGSTSTPSISLGASTSPAMFHLDGDAFLVTGTVSSTPTSGAGTRMMWVPDKFSFRAGTVSGAQWNAGSIGNYSVAGGLNNTASGMYAAAFGNGNTASGGGAFVAGTTNIAPGAQAAVFGDNNTASGLSSFAVGSTNVASGDFSAAFGDHTTAQAYKSMVIGRWNTIAGNTTIWNAADPLMVAGNGTGAGTTSNAMTLLKNGNMIISGTYTPSDMRLKTDFVPMSGVLEKLKNIQPSYFSYIDQQTKPAGRQLGFIAQQVQKEFPEAVITTQEGYFAVGYATMSAVAIQAVKEQQQIIDGLAAEKVAMAGKLDALNTRVDQRQTILAERGERIARLETMIHQLTGCCPDDLPAK